MGEPEDLSNLPSEDVSEPLSEANGESSSEDEDKLDNVCGRCLGSGKENRSRDGEDNQVSPENEGASRSNDELQTNLGNGRRIGSLYVSKVVIGKGASGTTVFEGTYGKRDGVKRPVAVKRLVKGHYHLASAEIKNFIASDCGPNILRYFTQKSDEEFLYLALELCDFSLDELIQACSHSSNKPDFPHEYKIKLDSVRDAMQDNELWRADGRPSPLLLELMRGVVSGLVHLHGLKLIHRDLNPRNVLITRHPSLCAKLSDMGISKLLPPGRSSLGYPASGSGTRGWQAPEQLLQKGRQTCKMDMFNLGCVLFFCLTKGNHPFGRDRARDVNIEENKMDLFLVEFIPEGHDLILRLLTPQSELRPEALGVLCEPFFWSSEKRSSFLCGLSDRLKLEKLATSDLLKALQKTAHVVFSGRWTDKIEIEVMNHLNKHRTYNGRRVQDLLRAVRNLHSHLRECPKNVQEIVGSVPEHVEAYLAKRFPRLLMESYKVAFEFCEKEEDFQKYFHFN